MPFGGWVYRSARFNKGLMLRLFHAQPANQVKLPWSQGLWAGREAGAATAATACLGGTQRDSGALTQPSNSFLNCLCINSLGSVGSAAAAKEDEAKTEKEKEKEARDR